MTKYRILSPLVGVPGEPFEPRPGINVEALVAGGFVEPVGGNDADKPAPRRKVHKEHTED